MVFYSLLMLVMFYFHITLVLPSKCHHPLQKLIKVCFFKIRTNSPRKNLGHNDCFKCLAKCISNLDFLLCKLQKSRLSRKAL